MMALFLVGGVAAVVSGAGAGVYLLKKLLFNKDGNKNKRRTDEYLSRLYKDVSLLHSKKWKEEEIKDIKKAVRNMMQDILIMAYSKEKLSKQDVEERLIPVGSMEEGTKVMDPDEFDFSFVIPEYHFGALKFNENETEEELVFGTFIVHPWAKILTVNNNNQALDKVSFLGDFSKRIIDSCQLLLKEGNYEIKGDMGTLKLIQEYDNKKAYVSQQGVAFHFEKRFIWTESVTLKQVIISVDLAPVIKPPHPGTTHFLDRMVGYFVVPFKSTVMLKRLIATISEDKEESKKALLKTSYVKTFVVDENERVRKMEREHHQWFICYVLMKYFTDIEKNHDRFTLETTDKGFRLTADDFYISGAERQTNVSSYNWKTMTLKKVYENKKDYSSVWECFKNITEPFMTSDRVKIPYLGNPGIEEIICVTDAKGQQTPTVRIIKEIRQILEKVSNSKTMTYEEFKRDVLNVVPKRLEENQTLQSGREINRNNLYPTLPSATTNEEFKTKDEQVVPDGRKEEQTMHSGKENGSNLYPTLPSATTYEEFKRKDEQVVPDGLKEEQTMQSGKEKGSNLYPTLPSASE